MGQSVSLAARYRAHGEALALAQKLGCTPRQAASQIRRKRLELIAEKQREQAKAQIADQAARKPRWDDPWMMRD